MPIYEYPQVPRTHGTSQPQPHQAAEDQQPPHNDNRFSFVPTPAEARGYSWHRSSTNPRHSVIPPLPQLPEHLNPHHDTQPTHIVQIKDEYDHPDQALHRNPAPVYDHYPEHSSGHPTALISPSDTSTLTRPSTSHTLNTQPEAQLSHDYKDISNMHYTQMPAPPDPPTHQPRHPVSTVVAPDSNPLSPTTPIKAHLPSQSNTTNMAILPPSHSQTAPVTNFSPLPQPQRGGAWHYSLFSCGEPAICLTSLFCPCITYGRTQFRLSQRSDRKDPTNMLGHSACNGSCVAFGVLCGFNAILAAIQKTRVRKAYEMSGADAGGVLDDCVKSVCCCCCSVAQDEKEVKWREEEARRSSGAKERGEGRNSREGYVPVGGMSFMSQSR